MNSREQILLLMQVGRTISNEPDNIGSLSEDCIDMFWLEVNGLTWMQQRRGSDKIDQPSKSNPFLAS
ncbi:MAG: hypothetical protein JJ868_19210 [Shimia sp.]|uniref:hypothetical protein n=1 Tax=Shimia sp. TaxID=1954381 RepID=UPI001B2263D0|nr:hypothetical protein [Shimia sp.]MBO6899498.1 hypothetical protein [Shimia sp.]